MINPKEELERLGHGRCWIWLDGDRSCAEIWRLHDVFILFGVFSTTAESWYQATYLLNEIDELIEQVENWS